MYRDQTVTVVVPAHNEARFIGEVIRTMPPFVDCIVVVDDCSTDATSEVAGAAGDPRVTLRRTPVNSGVGGAMAVGYREAIEQGSSLVVKMDGDGQMRPEYLARLLDPVLDDRCDYAKGNRFLAARALDVMPKHRLIGNIMLTFLTKMATGYWHIFDPQNGYTAIKGSRLRQLDLEQMNRGYFFENEMLSQLYHHGARVQDVEIPAKYADEESGISYSRVLITFPVLFTLKFVRRIYERYILRDFSPVALFLLVGVPLFGWGAAFGIYLWIRSEMTLVPTPIGTIMLSLLPVILGFQLILQAIVLDIHETPR